jgi:hypothetical protein
MTSSSSSLFNDVFSATQTIQRRVNDKCLKTKHSGKILFSSIQSTQHFKIY